MDYFSEGHGVITVEQEKMNLELLSTRQFMNGVIELSYTVKPK